MKILLAIDYSAFSQAAVEAVRRRRKPAQCEVLVLNALDAFATYAGIGPIEPAALERLFEEERKSAEELANRARQVLEGAGFKVSTRVEKGDARDVILDVASEWQPNLIVVGSHGRRGLERFLLGSVSEAVLRNSECSVEIVRV